MRSIEAFKILANDTRPMEETTTWSPPTISRLYGFTGDNGRATGKYTGYSVETNGEEKFYALGGKPLGHTTLNEENHRVFFDADGHKLGHEIEGGGYRAEPRHVHVHKHAVRQAKGHSR